MSKNPIATGKITVSTIETNIGSALIEICAPLARYDTRSGVINGERIVDTVVIPTKIMLWKILLYYGNYFTLTVTLTDFLPILIVRQRRVVFQIFPSDCLRECL